MKPATDPEAGAVIETTTRRRIVPANESQSAETPELWTYLRSIQGQDWAKHMVYVYRIAPPPSITLLKSGNQYLSMPGGAQVPLADQEEVEFALTQAYGGGTYRIIVKRGAQWVTQGKFDLGGPSKAITIPIDTGTPTSGTPTIAPMNGADSTTLIAGKAIDTIAGQEHQAVNLGLGMMTTAANVLKSVYDNRAPGGGAPSPMDEMYRQLMSVMLQRMLQPPPDPLELLAKLLTLQSQMNPSSQPNELLSKVMTVAVEKILNPAPAGSPMNGTAALIQMLPTVGSQFVEGVRAFAEARKAEAQIVMMQRGVQPGVPAPPGPQLIPPAIPAPAQTQPNAGAPSMDFIDNKIIEIFKQPISAEQAADEVMTFLQALDPNALPQLASLGEQGLVALFQSRPILRQATNNMPRLVEFVRAFLKMHAEDQLEAGKEPAKPPLPN